MTSTPLAKLPRVVELLRVSGQGQADRDTPEDQRRALDKLRDQFPGNLVECIDSGAVRAVSGAKDLNDRPDLRRLAELARAKAFDELRVRALDRLTRHTDPRERFAIFGMVMDAGAIIRDASGHTIDPKSELGEVDYFLQTWMSAKERKAIRERTLAARHRLSEQGIPMTHTGYGRRFDRHNRTWSLVESEAALYRRMFAEVLAGKSLPAIAEGLNREGIPAPKGGPWLAGTIRGMVRAENAIGIQRSYGARIPCPPIVDAATQTAALAALRRNAVWSGPRTNKHEALLRKLARCSCGAVMHVTPGGSKRPPTLFYACASRRKPGGAEGDCKRYHPVAKVDGDVRDALRPVLANPRALIEAMKRQAKGGDGSAQEVVDEVRGLLADLQTREERLVRLASKGMMSDAVYEQQAGEVAKLRQGAESRLSVALAHVEAEHRQAVRAKDVEEAVRDLQKGIAKNDFVRWRRRVEILFSAPGCSVVIGADGQVDLDGRLPLLQSEGATGCSSRKRREPGRRGERLRRRGRT